MSDEYDDVNDRDDNEGNQEEGNADGVDHKRDVYGFKAPPLPENKEALQACFRKKPRMLTDEVQSLLPLAYEQLPKLPILMAPISDPDCIEGSLGENLNAIVHAIREFAIKSVAAGGKDTFPLSAAATLKDLKKAYKLVLNRAGLGLRQRRLDYGGGGEPSPAE